MSSKGFKTCASCNGTISSKVLEALGKTWHPEHFTCQSCKRPIGEEKFQMHDGFAYCLNCYTEKFAKRCHACKIPIKQKVVKALDFDWHEECFACANCRKTLLGGKFNAKDGNPFCIQCYNEKFAARCKECENPITEQVIIALDANWHQNCFKCLKCKQPIEDNTFQVESGRPLCGKC